MSSTLGCAQAAVQAPAAPDPASSLGHMPGDRWAFDGPVTQVFDDMLARSIPQYEVMRDLVYTLGRAFVRKGTDIVDLGCSRGEALWPFTREFGSYCRYAGVELSAPMAAAARERYATFGTPRSLVEIYERDLREWYPPVRASLTLCVLTLMFTPIEYRPHILKRAYQHTAPGGALILVEKLLGSTSETHQLFTDRYYELKRAHGYSQEEIDRKRLALEGVQVPVTARWNEDLLIGAGFTPVECFFRWCNFAGWLAIRTA